MKSSIRQKLLWAGIILAFFLMEACNRGIGCPSEF